MCQVLTLAPVVKSVRNQKQQGMNWCSKPKRLAIYTRDGFACVYCAKTLEDGAKLTLDHLKPHSLGGTNEASNLVTSCNICNSSRGIRSVEDFANSTADYFNNGLTGQDIVNHILECIARPLDTKAAKESIAHRGWWVKSK